MVAGHVAGGHVATQGPRGHPRYMGGQVRLSVSQRISVLQGILSP